MSIETGKIEGDFTVESNFQLDGIITGSVTVKSGLHFQLNGVVNKDIFIENGASAQINGVVSGSITNAGGTLIINGIVNGAVSGQAEIHPNAIVGRRS